VAVGAGEINNQMAIISVQEFGTLAGAAGNANNPKDFSGKEKNNILKKETKIAPTVLSVKDESKDDYLNFGKEAQKPIAPGKNYFSEAKNYFAKNSGLIFEKLQIVSALILFMSLLLMPAVFIFEALKMIMINYSLGRKLKSDKVAEAN
jgi:hypothetical protein